MMDDGLWFMDDGKKHQTLILLDETLDKELTSNYHLSVQLGLKGLVFCIFDTQRNKYLSIESYRFDKIQNYQALCDEISTLVKKNSLLQKKFKSVSAIFVHNKSTLIPAPLYEKSSEKNYLDFNHFLEKDEIIVADKLQIIDSFNLYALPKCIGETLKTVFPEVKIFHYSSALIENLLIQYKNHREKQMVVHFQQSHFEVIVSEGKDLILYNSFNYRTKEDFVYYVLFVYEQLKLNPERLKLVLIGEIEERSEFYKLLFKYVKNISFGEANHNGYEYSYVFDEVPKHFYYNLFGQYLLNY